MNSKAVYAYLSIKANRRTMINKITNGLKHKDINVTKDPEVEEFQKGFLENWKDLNKFSQAAEDLKGLSESEKKIKIKELKLQFCEWVGGDAATSEGYMYAFEKKEQVKGQIVGVGRSMASKTKAAMKAIIGSNKLGRNDPCHCGSNIKYKNCCLRNE